MRAGIPLALLPGMHFQSNGLAAACCGLVMALAFPSPLAAETRVLRHGDDLQTVLNAASPGDVIVLEPGAEFVGNFVLPAKADGAPIVIRSAPSAGLPPAGARITPDHAPLLARLRSPNALAALRTASGARRWALQYLEFAGNQNGYGDIIQLGDGSSRQNTLAQVPQHIALRHVYVHGDPVVGQKRCIALNAAHVTIEDSHIAECKAVSQDSQAIGGWNGPGPFLIQNNYLEGAGENVMFGGADPAIDGLVASNITFRRNHVRKPPAWRDPILTTPAGVTAVPESGGTLPGGEYAYRIVARRKVAQGVAVRSAASAEVRVSLPEEGGGAVRLSWDPVAHAVEYRVYGRTFGGQGTSWTTTAPEFLDTGDGGLAEAVPASAGSVWMVKNLFELKNARNVVIEDNVFENNWKQGQPGYAIVLTPRNSGGGCSWCVVEDVRFAYNVVRHTAAGINLLGYDVPSRPSRQTRGIVIRHNLFFDVGPAHGGNGWFLLIGDEPRDVLVDHNTISHAGNAVLYAYGGTAAAPRRILGFRFTNNAFRHGRYGINGDFFSYGNAVIQGFFPDGTVTGNFLAGGAAARYPAGNRTAGSFESEFVDAAAGDFRLRPGSQLRGAATDGGDIGADMGNLLARVSRVEEGRSLTVPVSRPSNVRLLSR